MKQRFKLKLVSHRGTENTEKMFQTGTADRYSWNNNIPIFSLFNLCALCGKGFQSSSATICLLPLYEVYSALLVHNVSSWGRYRSIASLIIFEIVVPRCLFALRINSICSLVTRMQTTLELEP